MRLCRSALPRRERDLIIADQILGSFEQERLGFFARLRMQPFWRLTITEGVGDIEALVALDTKIRERHPHATLAQRGMRQADTIAVALVCMAYACTHDGADVLKGQSVRAPGTSYFLQFHRGLSFCL